VSSLPKTPLAGPSSLASDLHWAAEFLPSQGPLTAFIHHNTLHAFQHLSFDEAVCQGAKVYGAEPYMSEEWYRLQFERSRILRADVEWSLERLYPPSCAPLPGLTQRELHLALLFQPVQCLPHEQIAWQLAESEFAGKQGGEDARALWESCLCAVQGLSRAQAAAWDPVRHRDFLLQDGRADSDSLVHPILIRWCAAFLDQGVAGQSLAGRELGLYQAVRRLYLADGWLCPAWLEGLSHALLREQQADWTAEQSLAGSLLLVGVTAQDRARYLRDTMLSLKGWAGMIYQAELRPDRLPFAEVPARLVDFCALFLLVERFALQHCAGRGVALEQLRPALATACAPRTTQQTAFELFQICGALALGAAAVRQWSQAQVLSLLDAAEAFDTVQRRRVLHMAYERNYEVETLDALAAHRPVPAPAQRPSFQAVFCIDEREESTRRHLEEVDPACETFATAGFFGVPMYFKALHEPHPVALCPVVIKPRHLVEEVVAPHAQRQHEQRQSLRRSLGHLTLQLQTGSHTLTWGSLLTSVLGLLSSLPAISRVLFPHSTGRIGRRMRQKLLPPATRLRFSSPDEQSDAGSPCERLPGFRVDEMTTIVGNLLRETGLARRLAPLVFILGHGSSSLNNPHEAAYDCGACGGGRGGPNARVFAAMANRPEVREALRAQGLDIPADTRFVGGYHNTCDEHLEFYDLDGLGEAEMRQLQHARTCLLQARSRDAQERCRRFEPASLSITPAVALAHVQARSEDLAQPRPEYGHATNATCIVGRRSRTRGLFMDRRAFLVSYDPELDDSDGTLLGRVLTAVVPVGAGINLEYYFSCVDNERYGCGTKLPHNITGLLGVMDGHCSDLRTGLAAQMVEIHEPVRLLALVESTPAVLARVLERHPQLLPWASNGWIKLALLDPLSQNILTFDTRSSSWLPYTSTRCEIPRVSGSREWFAAKRQRLGYAEILTSA
jgi:uncharacterized protein